MNRTTRVLLADYMAAGSLEPEEMSMLTTAIRYNQLMQELQMQGTQQEIVSRKNQAGAGQTLNEKLVQISYNKEGELQIRFYLYQPGLGAYGAQKEAVGKETINQILGSITGKLPGGKLTLDYLLKHPNRVSELLERLAVKWEQESNIGYEEEMEKY